MPMPNTPVILPGIGTVRTYDSPGEYSRETVVTERVRDGRNMKIVEVFESTGPDVMEGSEIFYRVYTEREHSYYVKFTYVDALALLEAN